MRSKAASRMPLSAKAADSTYRIAAFLRSYEFRESAQQALSAWERACSEVHVEKCLEQILGSECQSAPTDEDPDWG